MVQFFIKDILYIFKSIKKHKDTKKNGTFVSNVSKNEADSRKESGNS